MKKILILLSLCACCSAWAQTTRQLENLEAFNKLYGYVKYFHPSDEAAALDWDRFAVYGSREVEKCGSADELRKTLLRLFLPIAPTVNVLGPEEAVTFPKSMLTPSDTSGFKVVTWQHKGLGSANTTGPYASKRTNRKGASANDDGIFSTITESLTIEAHRNKAFRVSASVRILEGTGTGHLWTRVDRADGQKGFFDNMSNRPITWGTWMPYEISGTIDGNATRLYFGCFLKHTGKLAIDNLQVSIQEENEWKTIYTNSFESDKPGAPPQGIMTGASHKTQVTDTDAVDGNKSVIIEIAPNPTKLMFRSYCKVGEYAKKDIGSGLTAIVPLALYGNENYTYPRADPEKLAALNAQISNVSVDPGDLHARLGGIITTWNVFQHFYPYFETVGTDWNSSFRRTIREAYDKASAYDFLKTLRKLTAQLKDGHVQVHQRTSNEQEGSVVPLQWEWIEGKLVITKILDATLPIKTGEIVTHIDQKKAGVHFEEACQYVSAATKGWMQFRTQTTTLQGPAHSRVTLTVLDAGNKKREVSLSRSMPLGQYSSLIRSMDGDPVRKLADDIYYIHIGMASMHQIKTRMPELQKATSLICDLRGYPNDNHDFIGHLLQQNDTSRRWMRVPQIIYPDQENITGYSESGWRMTPLTPHLNAKIFFLVDGRAISYAESYMSFIEHYKLATIIGQPSAGTNGNVNVFTLPGDYRISWTGMKVMKHDGTTHHGVGITPDVYVERTIKGVRENRDEFLDKAMELANQYRLKEKQ